MKNSKKTDYSAELLDLQGELVLNKIKNLIDPFKDMKMLSKVSCSKDFYNYLMNHVEAQENKLDKFNSFQGVEICMAKNQKEPIKFIFK
jgi:hypothetical protein